MLELLWSPHLLFANIRLDDDQIEEPATQPRIEHPRLRIEDDEEDEEHTSPITSIIFISKAYVPIAS